MSEADRMYSDDIIPIWHVEDELAGQGRSHEQQQYVPDNVIPLQDFYRELAAQVRLAQEQEEDQLRVRFRNWAGDHKEVITITGTTFAIGVALGGLYAARKKRQN